MKKGKLLITLEILRQMLTKKGSSSLPKVILILAVLYLFVPVDFIPDFVPFIGLLDDLGVISLAITGLTYLFKKFKRVNFVNNP